MYKNFVETIGGKQFRHSNSRGCWTQPPDETAKQKEIAMTTIEQRSIEQRLRAIENAEKIIKTLRDASTDPYTRKVYARIAFELACTRENLCEQGGIK